MSEDDPDEGETPDDSGGEADADSLRDRLSDLEDRLDSAETEDDLDDVEAGVDDLEADLEAADLEDDDAEEELQEGITDLRDGIEEQRGPYAGDVVSELEGVQSTVVETSWTDDGGETLRSAVGAFLAEAGTILDESFDREDDDPESLAASLDQVTAAVEAADLDPDRDADTIADLLDAIEEFEAAVREAETELVVFRERLSSLEDQLETAGTEDDLDDVEASVDDLEADLEEATLLEPVEDEDPPESEIEDGISDLHDGIEEQRGPYAEDVISEVGSVQSTITGTRWTDDGEVELQSAVGDFLTAAGSILDESFDREGDDPDALAASLDQVTAAIEAADLDPDRDADTIGELLDAVGEFEAGVEDAEEWDDLTVRQKLDYQGFYDVLDHRKDFPPEWNAVKVYEKRNEPEPILLAFDLLDSDFMEENCMEALKRLGPEEAVDAMSQKAQRRDLGAIEVLGKIGSEEPLDMLLEYAGEDSNPNLQRASLKALGEIGSREATQAIADQLASDDPNVRSQAARSLGLIGDTRAIEPLADVLAEDDADEVRASAAWALNWIGTEDALDRVREYADDAHPLVQAEAEKAV